MPPAGRPVHSLPGVTSAVAQDQEEEHDVPVETMDPRSPVRESLGVMAVRPSSLRGLTVGGIANGLGDSELVFDRLLDLLTETDGVADTLLVVKRSVAVPPSAEQWARLTDRASVAITGFGGCGSCSTRSMRDALELEAIGIPAVCIVHEALVPAVRALARYVGAPGYPIVTVGYPHDPTGHWTKDEAGALADSVVDAVRELLVAS
jgi:hypothetical protein